MAEPWEKDAIVEDDPWDQDLLASSLESEILARSESLKTRGKKGEEKYESEMIPDSPYARHEDPYRVKTFLRNRADDPLFTKALGGGAWNAAKEAAQTSLAGSSEINEGIKGIENPYLRGGAEVLNRVANPVGSFISPEVANRGVQSIEENVPEYDPEGFEQKLVTGATQTAVGMFAGDKGGGAILRNAKSIPSKIGKLASRFTASEAGGAVTQNSEEETWVLKKLGWDTENPTFIQHKLDLLQENMLVGALAGAAGKTASKAGEILTGLVTLPLRQYKSFDAYQKKFTDDLLAIYADIGPDSSRDEVLDAYQRALEHVKANQKVAISFQEFGVDDVQRSNDTISSMLENLDMNNPEQARIAKTLESLRSSALSGGGPRLTGALEAPRKDLKDTLKQVQDFRGEESINVAKDKVVEYGQRQLEVPRQKIRDARGELVAAERGVEAEMAGNPAFKEITDKQPGKDVTIDFTDGQTDISTKMTGNIASADQALTKRKNDLYDAIPETAQVNTASLGEAITKADPFIDDVLREKLDEAGGNFKKLYQLANVDIEKEIQIARSLGTRAGYDKADALRDLKKNITDDQLDYMALPTSGDQATVKAATEARDFFKDEYAPKFRDGPLEDMQRNRRFKPETEALVDNRRMLEGVISDPKQREYTAKVLDVLDTPEGGKSASDAVDYALYSVATDIRKSVNITGKLTPEDALKISTAFDRFIPILKKKAPEKIKEIEGFLTSLRDKNFNVKEVQAKLAQLEVAGKKAEETILGQQLGEFFKKSGDGFTAVRDGYEVFDKMMSSREGSAKLVDLITSVDDPLVQGGLKTAWAKSAAKRMLDSDAGIGKLDEDFVNVGKSIFGENSKVPQGIQQLYDLARKGEGANKIRMASGLETNSFQVGAVQAVNAVITTIWGVLNPTAARVRIVTRDLMKKYDPKDEVKKAADLIIANAEEFTKIADRLIAEKRKQLSPQERTLVFRMLVQAGLSESRDEKQVLKQMQASEETEDAFREKE